MKRYLNPKNIILGTVIVVFCFAPFMPVSYEVVVQKQVEEEYTTIEPYIVLEEVEEPYMAYPSLESGLTKKTVQLRTVTKEITKYREVTKIRLITQPIVETRTKRVSTLRYLLIRQIDASLSLPLNHSISKVL